MPKAKRRHSKQASSKKPDQNGNARAPEIMKRKPQTRLLLVSGTGDSRILTDNILPILRDTYGLEQAVEVLKPEKNEDVESIKKSHTYPFVLDRFPDGEIRVDVGRNTLFDIVRGKHVAIIRHLYTPTRIGYKRPNGEVVLLPELVDAIRKGIKYDGKLVGEEEILAVIKNNISLNDHTMGARGVLNVLKYAETLKKTLVAPYLPYLRSHSVDKYKKKGFFQFDSLDLMLDDFQRGGVECLICIDPHSDKLIEVAQKYSIDVHAVNPFRSSEMINPAKLGLSEDKSDNVLSDLQPFIEYYREVHKKFKRIYFISPDDGAEKRVEIFLVECKRQVDARLSWDNMGYRDKTRDTMQSTQGIFKSFSRVKEEGIDKEGMYIVIDDMLSSGGTAEEIAKLVKSHGGKRVDLLCTHAVAPERDKVERLKYLDSIVVLDTIIHDNPKAMRIHYLNATHHLMAAELYKAHMKLEDERSRV